MIDFLNNALGSFLGLMLGGGLLWWLRHRQDKKLAELFAKRAEVEARSNECQIELEHARAMMAVGHHTDDRAMMQRGMAALYEMKSKYAGQSGVTFELDIKSL